MTLAKLRETASELGITAEEAKDYGPISKKTTWEMAIADVQRRYSDQAVHQAYQSGSAPITVPLGIGIAVGTVLIRNISGILTRKP